MHVTYDGMIRSVSCWLAESCTLRKAGVGTTYMSLLFNNQEKEPHKRRLSQLGMKALDQQPGMLCHAVLTCLC